MWCGLLLVGLLATGTQAFHPAPILWDRRFGKKLFLAPTVPLVGIAPPQQLTLQERFDRTVPYFKTNQDNSISCDDNDGDMRWCIEASGTERGDAVRVNHCTSRPTQKWRWLPWGPIQLEGTNQCIHVNEKDGFTIVSVELSECANKAADAWMFEDTAPVPARSSLQSFPCSVFLIGAAVMVAALSLGVLMWRGRKESGIALASTGSVPLKMKRGGVCLIKSIAVRSNKITMKLPSAEDQQSKQSNDAALARSLFRSGYKRGDDDGSIVDDIEIESLLAERGKARKEKRFNDADAIKNDLNAMGVLISDKDREWTVRKRNRVRKRGRSASGYTRNLDDRSVIDEMAVEELLTERVQARRERRFQEANDIKEKLRWMGVLISETHREWKVAKSKHNVNNLIVEGVPCQWINTWAEAEAAVLQLRDADYVAVDLEGRGLGHNGRAVTIQLYGGGESLQGTNICYIVDLPAVVPAAPGTPSHVLPDSLRWLLESGSETTPPGPLKVCHSFEGDQINLIEQFNLDFSKADLFDTKVALKQLQSKGEDEYTNLKEGLLDVLTAFGTANGSGFTSELATEMRAIKGGRWQDINLFARPLQDDLIRYMCLDVLYLGPAHVKLKELLTHKQVDDRVIASVMEASRYTGPYGKGDSYRPPTRNKKERQFKKGELWCEETRTWVEFEDEELVANASGDSDLQKIVQKRLAERAELERGIQ